MKFNMHDKLNAPGGETRYCCPFCEDRRGSPDTDYHLYVNPNAWDKKRTHRGWFFCHRCEIKGWYQKLFEQDGTPPSMEELDADLESIDDILSDTEEYPNLVYPVKLPTKCKPLTKLDPEFFYLKQSRHLKDSDILPRRLFVVRSQWRVISPESQGKSPEYDLRYPRLLIPDYNDRDEIIYYVTASAYKQDTLPKYMNCPDKENSRAKVRGYSLFYYHMQRKFHKDYVIVCEGPISAISAGHGAVASLGKHITENQMLKLMELKKEIILALDADVLHLTLRFLEKLLDHAKVPISYIPMYGEDDPNEILKRGESFQDLIDKRVRIDNHFQLLEIMMEGLV